MGGMFYNCNMLKQLDLRTFSLEALIGWKGLSSVIGECKSLKDLYKSGDIKSST